MKGFRDIFIITALALSVSSCASENGTDNKINEVLRQLDRIVADSDIYIYRKESRIAGIKSVLNDDMTIEEKYRTYDRIYDEYYQYNLDSAIVYAKKKYIVAQDIHSSEYRIDAMLDLAERHILSSVHVAAKEILDNIDTTVLDKGFMCQYYHNMQSLYEDMTGCADALDLKDKYNRLRKIYRQLRLEQLDSTNIEYLYVRSEIMRETGRGKDILPELLKKCENPDTDTHQKAILNYIISNIYRQEGDSLKVVYHYALSAINDLSTPVNDYTSLRELAKMLYNAGDIKRAYSYITRAVEDMLKAHSRLNLQATIDILPVITNAYDSQLEKKQGQLKSMLYVLSILLALFFYAMITIFKERRLVRKKNDLLTLANAKLRDTNRMLLETNDIKEAYLTKYMDLCSTYIENIEDYRSQLRKIAKTGGFEKILENLRSANYTDTMLHDFYAEFDRTFLKLFPDFASQLNNMLQPGQRLKDTTSEGILTTELRVMALIRLGINDSTKIAHFLRRSLSTIYNYRVKIRNAALYDRDNFESRVMQIPFSPQSGKVKGH